MSEPLVTYAPHAVAAVIALALLGRLIWALLDAASDIRDAVLPPDDAPPAP